MSNFTKAMLERAQAAGIPLNAVQAEKFETYHRMLIEANARFNLTRVPDDEAEAIDRNYLDCIALLAIGLPETRIVLMDSLGKRVEFLHSVIEALHLNARAVHLRAEDGARKPEYREAFDLATARAVAPLNLLCEYLLPFVKPGGRMLALKGPGLDEEVAAAENALSILGGRFLRSDALPIPGRDWDHRAAWIEKVAPTSDKYPRRAGKPEKKPL